MSIWLWLLILYLGCILIAPFAAYLFVTGRFEDKPSGPYSRGGKICFVIFCLGAAAVQISATVILFTGLITVLT